MFELLIVISIGFIVFAFFMVVMMVKNKSEETPQAGGCCGDTDSTEKIGCAHCSGHIKPPPKISSEDRTTL